MCTDGHFNNIGTKIGTCRLCNLSTVDNDASFWRIALCRTDDAEQFTLQHSKSGWQNKLEVYIMEKNSPWHHLVVIQCTKPPDVAKRTAELLAEVGHGEDGKQLKGQ